jgi:pseudaminic acid cytidylyltransferase
VPTRLAVIPARGGSKRIPGKNVREFAGRPMIAHILQTARTAGLFDVIHVSTESGDIARVVEDLGFPVSFLRPAELADDHTPLMPVLRYEAEAFIAKGFNFDEVWMLMACAPLIEENDLYRAAQLFAQAGGRRAVLPVAAYPAPIEWAFRMDGDGNLTPAQPSAMGVRSQDFETKYYDTGTFSVLPLQMVLQSTGAGDFSDYIGYLLERVKAIDIDDEDDWALAEIVFAGLRTCRRR